MKVLILAAVVIFLLFLYSVRIVYSVKLKNFEFSAKLTLKLPFTKELFNSKKSKKTKKVSEEKNKKPKRKIDLDTVLELKEPITIIVSELCKAIRRQCKIVKTDTFVKVALEDPMENGVAFGIVSGVFNIGSAILMDKCKVKNIDLKIESDFESGEGLIFETYGTLKIRPLVLAVALVFNIRLIKAIKNVIMILKREDTVNG